MNVNVICYDLMNLQVELPSRSFVGGEGFSIFKVTGLGTFYVTSVNAIP